MNMLLLYFSIFDEKILMSFPLHAADFDVLCPFDCIMSLSPFLSNQLISQWSTLAASSHALCTLFVERKMHLNSLSSVFPSEARLCCYPESSSELLMKFLSTSVSVCSFDSLSLLWHTFSIIPLFICLQKSLNFLRKRAMIKCAWCAAT